MNARNIVVKTLLNADEFLKLETACKQSDISQSKALRDLANHWVNDRRLDWEKERPACGHKRAIHTPNRARRPSNFRLRQ